MNPPKRYAAHYLFVTGTGFLKQHVVERREDGTLFIRPLTEEVESAVWVPGVILVLRLTVADYRLVSLYPFNFETMKPDMKTRVRVLDVG